MNDLIDNYYKEKLNSRSNYSPIYGYKYFEPGDKEAEVYYATLETIEDQIASGGYFEDKTTDPDNTARVLAALIVTCKRLQDRIEILEKERE
jgi:hypothetical protein